MPDGNRSNIAEIREMARAHDRHHEIGFGMRLQVICRENEADAWEAKNNWHHALNGRAIVFRLVGSNCAMEQSAD